MHVYSRFPGDDSGPGSVAYIQHDCYSTALWAVFNLGMGRGLHAERILGLETSEVGDFCRRAESFDHRILQDMHDQIAAIFRFRFHRWPLFRHETTEKEVRSAWLRFVLEEMQGLMFQTEFAVGFFDALRFPNTERGVAGEQAMRNTQRLRYSEMHSYTLPTYSAAESWKSE